MVFIKIVQSKQLIGIVESRKIANLIMKTLAASFSVKRGRGLCTCMGFLRGLVMWLIKAMASEGMSFGGTYGGDRIEQNTLHNINEIES